MRAQREAFEEVQAESGGQLASVDRWQVIQQAVMMASAAMRALEPQRDARRGRRRHGPALRPLDGRAAGGAPPERLDPARVRAPGPAKGLGAVRPPEAELQRAPGASPPTASSAKRRRPAPPAASARDLVVRRPPAGADQVDEPLHVLHQRLALAGGVGRDRRPAGRSVALALPRPRPDDLEVGLQPPDGREDLSGALSAVTPRRARRRRRTSRARRLVGGAAARWRRCG